MKARLFSTSTIHGSGYLDYCEEEIQSLFAGVKEVIFVPFARPSGITLDAYTEIARKKFESLGLNVKGIHEFADPVEAVNNAYGFFTGGGNSFLLLKTLYELDLIGPLRDRVVNGASYMGTSAGSNVAGISIGTTNDMPIVYPPSFEALGLVNININPHYLDPDPSSTHKGETRETRIREFHFFNDQPVIGLREGSWLAMDSDQLSLGGALEARIFEAGKAPYEVKPTSDLNFLLT